MIKLEEAKQLVLLLEVGDQAAANALWGQLTDKIKIPLCLGSNRSDAKLNTALPCIELDPCIEGLATKTLSDTKERLIYVIEQTELAVNTTIGLVEETLPAIAQLKTNLQHMRSQMRAVTIEHVELNKTNAIELQLNEFFALLESDCAFMHDKLTAILTAQNFQDLTGQAIYRVMEVMKDIESQLVKPLTACGCNQQRTGSDNQAMHSIKAEGPIINTSEQVEKKVIKNQSDVDDLLNDLGF